MSDNHALEQAKAQAASIIAMVAALNVDYDRLEELKDEIASLKYSAESANLIVYKTGNTWNIASEGGYDIQSFACTSDKSVIVETPVHDGRHWTGKSKQEALISWAKATGVLSDADMEELSKLEESANGNTDADEAREAIQNDALDVQVRSDWHSPGDEDGKQPSEFSILLCTGGPAVRIRGELNQHCEPSRAWIEYQDWGTPWTQLFNEISQDDLLTYCQQFYFGE